MRASCSELMARLLLGLLLGGVAEANTPYETEGAPAPARSTRNDLIDARLAEAERLASSGDYATVERVLAEAREQAGEQAGLLDAIDRVQARIEFRRGRYADARLRHQGILQRASARGDLAGVAHAELDIGMLARRQGDLGSALGGFERALAIFRQIGDRDGVASVLTHIGLVRLNQGEYSVALEALTESRQLQESGARAELERTLHYLGLLYAGLREYETSRSYLERGLTEARRLADASREAPLLGSMAKIANFRRAFGEALSLGQEAMRLAERLDSPPGRAYALLEQGRALLGLKRLREAREVLERGAVIADAIAQNATLADYRILLAEVAALEGRQQDALQLWELALPTYQKGDDQPQLLTVYRAMIPVLAESGTIGRALEIAQEALVVQEKLNGLDMNRRLAVQESRHRAEEAAREIEILRRDNEIKALRLAEAEARRWQAALVIFTLVAIALLLAWRYHESRRFGRRLQQANTDLLSSREALALANTELEKRAAQLALAASTDPLTGVANRREFTQRFQRLWDDALQRGSELSLLIIDADHFKRINDSLGHAVGDSVLCTLAQVLQGTVRVGTLLARWGGEEFAVVLPQADAEAARGLAERLRVAVRNTQRDNLPQLTISIGIASLHGRRLARPEELFDEADAALYRAKQAGRDRVEVAERPPG